MWKANDIVWEIDESIELRASDAYGIRVKSAGKHRARLEERHPGLKYALVIEHGMGFRTEKEAWQGAAERKRRVAAQCREAAKIAEDRAAFFEKKAGEL